MVCLKVEAADPAETLPGLPGWPDGPSNNGPAPPQQPWQQQQAQNSQSIGVAQSMSRPQLYRLKAERKLTPGIKLRQLKAPLFFL